MNRNEIVETLLLNPPHKLTKTDCEKIADWIEANFTSKGEAEKVTAKEMYKEMVGGHSARYGADAYLVDYEGIAKQAHEAAKAFNEYKPE